MSFPDYLRAGGSRRRFLRGFTLVELAMVLFIVALLLGGLLVPLATQLEGRQRGEAQIELQEIKEALIGYAIANDGNLPCYAENPTTGIQKSATPCAPHATTDQYLPWSTLGLTDGVDPWNQYWRYRVDQNFAEVSASPVSISTSAFAGEEMSIQELDSANSDIGAPVYNSIISSEYPVAIIYSMGANQVADHENAEYEETGSPDPVLYESGPVSNLDRDGDGEEDSDKFDDMLTWLNRPQLFYKLVNAEVLP